MLSASPHCRKDSPCSYRFVPCRPSVRNESPSITRHALSNGFMVGCWGLAALGFGEWLNGHAGPGILLAVVVELALGLAFLQTRRVSMELETVG